MSRTRRTVLLALAALLVLGGGAFLASSERARVRWWAWRMRSPDPAVATHARECLFAIWRPAVDEVLPELIARELEVQCAPSSCWGVHILHFTRSDLPRRGVPRLAWGATETELS